MTRATSEQVAEAAGVSRAIVSAVVNNASGNIRVSQDTAERVRREALRLGYRPNAFAKRVAHGRFDAIAFIQREDCDFMPYNLLRGVELGCSKQDLSLVFTRMTRGEIADSRKMPRLLSEASVDGLLVHEAAAIDTEAIKLIERHAIPTIWMNERKDTNCVYPDDHEAAQRITRQLLEWGHRRIAMCKFTMHYRGAVEHDPQSHYSSIDRFGGYREMMAEAGLTPQVISRDYNANPSRQSGEDAWDAVGDDRIRVCTEILQRPDRPTAIFAADAHAAGCWLVAARQLGLSMPKDLSLVAVAPDSMAMLGQPLAVLELPMVHVGIAAVEMLVQRIREDDREVPSRAIRYKRQRGNTWGPAPRA